MCHATVELKKWGNSLGIIIPKDKVEELGLSEHDIIDLDIVKKEMVTGFGIAEGKTPFKREHAAEHEALW
ncbi:MAG: Antitoxin component of the MazEF toxin-antitoxin module [Candidatus Methanocomedens sp.]|nr:MAG: Antitoxin component of the MazEF toxin-antitoxin module [ANME-2 cluster archaeon]